MIVTIIGAASTYTPLIIEGLISQNLASSREPTVVLFDPDSDTLGVIHKFAEKLVAEAGSAARILTATSLDHALTNATLVVTLFRAGGLVQRHIDEVACRSRGVLAQETQGTMGLISAYRQLEIVENLATAMKKHCPKALVVNISNPVHILTTAFLGLGVNAVGLCELPWVVSQVACRYFESADVRIGWFGLNHVAWTTSITVDGKESIDRVLAEGYAVWADATRPPHIRLPIRHRLIFDEYRLLPAPYLLYYYQTREVIRLQEAQSQTRAEETIAIRKTVLSQYERGETQHWTATLSARGGFPLSSATSALIGALQSPAETWFAGLNVANRGQCSWLAPSVVLEQSCFVSSSGIRPARSDDPGNPHIRGLLSAIVGAEDLLYKAAARRDHRLLAEAIGSHPAGTDYETALSIVDELIGA